MSMMTVQLVDADGADLTDRDPLSPTTCEGCGWWPLLAVRITDEESGEQRRAWWESLTVPGAVGEHTPARCRSEQAP